MYSNKLQTDRYAHRMLELDEDWPGLSPQASKIACQNEFSNLLKRFNIPVEQVLEYMDIRKEMMHPEAFTIDLSRLMQEYLSNLSQSYSAYFIKYIVCAYQLYRSQNISDIIASIVAFSLNNVRQGLTSMQVGEFLDSVFPTLEELMPQAIDLKSVKDGWTMLRTNPIFSKISLVITFLSAVFVSAVENTGLSLSLIPEISKILSTKHFNCVDVVDACIESVVWLVQTGYAVLTTQSITPIFYSDQTVRTFNSDYSYLDANRSSAINGSLSNAPLYRSKLSESIKTCKSLLDNTTNSVMRKFLHDKYCNLISIEETLVIKDKNTAMRFCPIGFSLFGDAGVGKTSLAKLTMSTSLFSMGFTTDEKHQVTVDPNDKYHTTMTNDIVGVYIDDLANTKSQFMSTSQSPAALVISMFNNVPAQALKADVDDKGKVSFNFKCGVVTTNKKDLDAHIYSNCPESILRRLHHVTVRVKPKYCYSGTSRLDTSHPDLLNQRVIGEVDVWELDIHTVVPLSKNSVGFVPLTVNINGSALVCTSLNLKQYLEVVAFLSKNHAVQQTNLLKGANSNAICMCSNHFIPKTSCLCQADILTRIATDIFWTIGYRPIKKYVMDKLFDMVIDNYDDFIMKVHDYCPDWFYRLPFFQNIVEARCKWMANIECKHLMFYLSVFAVISLFLTYVSVWIFPISICILIYLYAMYHFSVHKRYVEIMMITSTSRDMLTEYRNRVYGKYVPKVFYLGSAALVAWMALKYFKKTQLSPEADSLDQEKIDEQPGWLGSLWKPSRQTVQGHLQQANMIPQHLVNKIERNLFYCTFKNSSGVMSGCNAFFPKKCYIIVPKHIFYPGNDMTNMPSEFLDCMVRRNSSCGGAFSFTLSFNRCVFFKDLCLAYVPNCPSIADISHLLAEKISGSGSCVLIHKNQKMETLTDNVFAEHKKVSHKYMSFEGSSYHTHLSVNGACISTLICDNKVPYIVGFHIAGSSNSFESASIFLPLSQYKKMEEDLRSKVLAIEGTSNDLVPTATYGIPTIVNSLPHPNSYCYTLEGEREFDIVGMTAHRAQATSMVIPSIIHKDVLRVMKIENKWKPPSMLPNYVHYNKFIDNVTRPSKQFNPDILERAVDDYITPLRTLIARYNGVKRTLTDKESIMGIPGDRFISGLNMSSSMGFPLFKSKNKYFSDIYDDTGLLIDRIPDPILVEEIHRMLEHYNRGERAFPIFSACLKDEVKEITSEKVRVFTASPVALSILVRKYFLPITAFFQHFPKESEMAVGINAFGLQWEDLMNHVDQFADENGGKFGMDYSAYDTRMNSQLSRAAYGIMIMLARDFGYSQDDINVMTAMVEDLTHPLVDINGTLYQLYHINCSGNSVTVQINCLVNSLYMRICFFLIYPQLFNYRSYVALTTYGDDNKCSVHRDFRKYNFITIQEILAKHDIKITAPDKKSEGSLFFDDDKLDFLKRRSQYIPEIDRKLGRLEEDSIIKSLCWNLKSKTVTQKEVTISCIECALHEWFAYGRQHYNMRLKQLKEVAECVDLEDLPILSVTFEDRVLAWQEKYRPKPL